MNHNRFRELLSLSIYEELDSQDRSLLDGHLETCEACRTELRELQTLQAALGRKRRSEPTEQLLQDARHQLRAALRAERSRITLWDRIRGGMQTLVPAYRLALGAAAALVAGILVGRLAFQAPDQPVFVKQLPVEQRVLGTDTEITNVRFVDADASDGNVELTFEAVNPMRIKGNVQDPTVQQVLSYAISNENPGVRLRAASTLREYAPQNADPEVKKALIKALKTDTNEGVRAEALAALQKMPMDAQLKQVYLYVLKNDSNPGVRIEAIKTLQSSNADKDVQQALRDSLESDSNSYIRSRAKTLLREANQTM